MVQFVIVRVENKLWSDFTDFVSGVPQGSVAGLVPFNIYLIKFFFFLYIVSLLNFADDNALSNFAKTLDSLEFFES